MPDSDQQTSLMALADQLLVGTKGLVSHIKTEEDLRIGFEKLLDPIKKSLGIRNEAKYEKTVFHGRSDALHGQVVIEYEPPGSLRSPKNIDHAFDQLVQYINGLTQETKTTLFVSDTKFIGVGFDGEKIFFVRYKNDGKYKTEFTKDDFIPPRTLAFDPNSARTFLIHLRALSRLSLTPANLADKFGPSSGIAQRAVPAFADALEHWGIQVRIRTFFDEWKRLFGIVYGEQFNNDQHKSDALVNVYPVGHETDFQELLFAIHTYFAFLMKLIAAELLHLRNAPFGSSLSFQLTHCSDDDLNMRLEDMEDGGIYADKGITNFLEGDFFSWYLDAFDSPQLVEAIRDITRALAEFEPGTGTINPASTRDLLKKLYQYLVPREVRHNLGEYYTPDWLADLVLKEVGYDGDTLKKVLDPACGSGTFLVLAIQRAKQHGADGGLSPLEIAKRITNRIWGFDLNPLAVIAARTNYLFAMGDLANELEHFEIPVYLADSVLGPASYSKDQTAGRLFDSQSIVIPTSVGDFAVPKVWVDDDFLMRKAAPLIERYVKNRYESKEAITLLEKEGVVFPPHHVTVEEFYDQILQFERQGRDGIWARFLKNAVVPQIVGTFDFVVGNPPWIRWGYLSDAYRQATLHMWKQYGLFSLKGHAARLGGGEKDFSMLFTYAAADYFLKDGAKLGFLITQELFKSKGAGEGFRRFRLGPDGKHLRVIKAHDLVSVQPFEGAANKTAIIILSKGKPTEYPLPYTVWTRKKGTGKVPTDATMERALLHLDKEKLIARPIAGTTGAWQTMKEENQDFRIIEGRNFYVSKLGARVEPYGVFWLEIKQVLSDRNLLIRNIIERGKRTDIPAVVEVVESDLVYPAVSGRDIARWSASPGMYIVMSQDPATSGPFPETMMKKKWPRTYHYLLKFKHILLSRGSKTVRQLAERTSFYAMFGIGWYTMATYKVVWKRMANDLTAAVVSQYKTPFGYKVIIPTDTTSLFAAESSDEAHYLCAILNSIPVRDFIKSYSSGGRGFGAPSVMEHVGISKFDPHNEIHASLARLSKHYHQLKTEGKEEEVARREQENNMLVVQLFSRARHAPHALPDS